MSEKILLGTYTRRESKGIYSIELNKETKTLENLKVEAELGSPTYLDTSPDATFLYAVLKEDADHGGVAVFKKSDSGSYEWVDASTAEGAAPCYVGYDEEREFLYSANYHDGKVAVYQTTETGGISLVDEVQHSGKSVHENQKGPHAHYFNLTPDEEYLIACDLGTDEVLTYSVNEQGKLSEVDRISVAPGTGPRHIVFHPNGKFAYVFGELSSDVITLTYDPEGGTLNQVQTVSSLPDDFTGSNSGAAIRVTSDGKFVYVSNRGHNSIAIFAVDEEEGTLEIVDYASTHGEIPRDFNLNADEKFVVVGHQDSDNLTLFERDEETGKLTVVQKDVYAPEVVCVHFV